MRYAIAFAILLCGFSGEALSAKYKIPKGTHIPPPGLVVNDSTLGCTPSPCTGVVNKGTINGGTGTGLTVTGTPAQKVINNGTITGQTGLSVSGTSSSVIINTGVIKGVNVGVQQLP